MPLATVQVAIDEKPVSVPAPVSEESVPNAMSHETPAPTPVPAINESLNAKILRMMELPETIEKWRTVAAQQIAEHAEQSWYYYPWETPSECLEPVTTAELEQLASTGQIGPGVRVEDSEGRAMSNGDLCLPTRTLNDAIHLRELKYPSRPRPFTRNLATGATNLSFETEVESRPEYQVRSTRASRSS